MTKEEIQKKITYAESEFSTGNFVLSEQIALQILKDIQFQSSSSEDEKFDLLQSKALNVLGRCAGALGKYEKALEYFHTSISISEVFGDNSVLSNAKNGIGLVYGFLGLYDKALEYLTSSISISEKIGDKASIALTNGNIGIIYQFLGSYDKVLEYYVSSLTIVEETGDLEGIARITGNIGNVYQSLNSFENAVDYYKTSLSLFEKIGNKYGIANALIGIGNVYTSLGKYDIALENYKNSLLILEKIGDKSGIALTTGNIGNVYKSIGSYDKALEFYSRSLMIREEIGDKAGIATSTSNIGVLYLTLDTEFYDKEKAEKYLYDSLSISEEIGFKECSKGTYEHIHTIRISEGRFEEALEYYKKSVAIEKEIQSEETTKKAEQFDQRRKIEEDEKARQLKLARFQEQEKILHNILPSKIADRILNQETFIADYFQSTSVLFMDLVGFTTLASIAPPKQLVYLLDTIFQKADGIVETFGLEKIKTIGDGYLAVANVTTSLVEHQKATALAALQLLETMKDFTVNIPNNLGNTEWVNGMNDIEIRIGIHTGEVVAGIIGKNKYTYDLWGDAVNIASRMESNSEAGRIHISEEFAQSIEKHPEFSILPRGEISIKGKGAMNTYWLEKAK